MAAHHQDLCRRFSVIGANRFEDVAWRQSLYGPELEDAIAWIGCEIYREQTAGDHLIVLGLVKSLDAVCDGFPLIFFRRQFGTFAVGNDR